MERAIEARGLGKLGEDWTLQVRVADLREPEYGPVARRYKLTWRGVSDRDLWAWDDAEAVVRALGEVLADLQDGQVIQPEVGWAQLVAVSVDGEPESVLLDAWVETASAARG